MNQDKQPEALWIAQELDREFGFFSEAKAAISELRRLHARVQELEAAQVQRVPLSDAVSTVLEGFTLPHEVRKILEAAYYGSITQEKQG